MSQDTPVKKKVRSVSGINTLRKPCRTCKLEIVIIDPTPYQSTHFFNITLRIHRWICSGKAKRRRILPNSNTSRGEK